MNLTLPLTPAEESRLLAKARSEGTTPESLIRQAINPILLAVSEDASADPVRSSPKLTAAEADKAFEELLDTLPPMPSLSDRALSRESIYADDDSR